jgi:hypothetical protein
MAGLLMLVMAIIPLGDMLNILAARGSAGRAFGAGLVNALQRADEALIASPTKGEFPPPVSRTGPKQTYFLRRFMLAALQSAPLLSKWFVM